VPCAARAIESRGGLHTWLRHESLGDRCTTGRRGRTQKSSTIFEHTLPLFGEHIAAYALDTPGYGHSDPPPGPSTIPEYAAELLRTHELLEETPPPALAV
jgi:hypothetical protein